MGKPVRPVTPYLDASVVAALFKEEDEHSPFVRAWSEELTLKPRVSHLGVGETHSVFSRLVRYGIWSTDEAQRASVDVKAWLTEQVVFVAVTDDDIAVAAHLVRTPSPKLLMPDAIHLALCRRLSLTLATFDKDLLTIAEREGVAALRPE